MTILNEPLFYMLIFQFSIILLLVIYLFKINSDFRKERNDYINRIVSKNTNEYISLKKVDKEPIRAKTDNEILGDDYRYFGGKLN